jgi:hypothetical protein
MAEINGTPKTPAELAREAEFLSIKCDELRHACMGFLDDGVTSPDVSSDDVAFVRSTPPQRTLEGVFAGYRKLREDPPGGLINGTPDQTLATIEALAGTRERLKRVMFALSDAVEPYTPLTEEEAREMMTAPQGESIPDIIAELEKEIEEAGHVG